MTKNESETCKAEAPLRRHAGMRSVEFLCGPRTLQRKCSPHDNWACLAVIVDNSDVIKRHSYSLGAPLNFSIGYISSYILMYGCQARSEAAVPCAKLPGRRSLLPPVGTESAGAPTRVSAV